MSPSVQTLHAPVTAVTLFEDRAQVRREGTLVLEPGEHHLVLPGVAPVLVNKSLHAESLAGGAEVVDLQVERRVVHRREVGDEALRALREKVEELERESRALKGEGKGLDRRSADLVALLGTTLDDLAVDVSWGRQDAAAWDGLHGGVVDGQAALRGERLDLRGRRREHKVRLRAARRELEEAEAGVSARETTLHLHLKTVGSGTVRLAVEYLVPNACWRPSYVARLSADELRCDVDVSATVWQATGEDWPATKLTCSTQRTSAGVAVPVLSDDLLETRPKQEKMAVEMRDQVVADTGLGRTEQAARVPGVDDGGEVRTWSCPEPVDVPGDGRPHRFRVDGFTCDVKLELVAVPELAPVAIPATTLVNGSALALLAGPVELIRAGGPAGRAQVAFVAPREQFRLGWGPDPAIRVHRDAWEAEGEARMMSSWIADHHTLELRLSNIGAEAKTLVVQERVPVSEVPQVEVEVMEATGGVAPDQDGFLRWTVTLPPNGSELVTLKWILRKKKDVVGI